MFYIFLICQPLRHWRKKPFECVHKNLPSSPSNTKCSNTPCLIRFMKRISPQPSQSNRHFHHADSPLLMWNIILTHPQEFSINPSGKPLVQKSYVCLDTGVISIVEHELQLVTVGKIFISAAVRENQGEYTESTYSHCWSLGKVPTETWKVVEPTCMWIQISRFIGRNDSSKREVGKRWLRMCSSVDKWNG